MSRRKRLDPPYEGQSRNFAVAVVCTDRGQHSKAVVSPPLIDSRAWADGEIIWSSEGKAPITDWRPADGSKTYQFSCSRCGRDVRLTRDSLGRVFDALDVPAISRESHPEIDISMLR